MKKIIILMFIMVLSLCACGGNQDLTNAENNSSHSISDKLKENEEVSICGKWKVIQTGETFTFKENGSVEYKHIGKDSEYKYEIKPDLNVVIIYMDEIYSLNIISENDDMYMTNDKLKFVPAKSYDEIRLQYINNKTYGSELIECGKEYICENGLEFLVNKAEIIELVVDDALHPQLVLDITWKNLDNEFEFIDDTKYYLYGSSFSGSGNWGYRKISDVDFEIVFSDDIYEGVGQDAYGVLMFNLAGSVYYINVNVFQDSGQCDYRYCELCDSNKRFLYKNEILCCSQCGNKIEQ